MRVAPSSTATSRLPGGAIDRWSAFCATMKTSQVPNIEHLARLYGTRLGEVLAIARERPELREPLSLSGDIGAQILFAVHEEAALTLEDVVMRRTGIGQLGHPSEDRLVRAADIMAVECGWDDDRKAREVAAVERNFTLATGPQ